MNVPELEAQSLEAIAHLEHRLAERTAELEDTRAALDAMAAKLEDMRGQRDFALEARTKTMTTNAVLQAELHEMGQRATEAWRLVHALETERDEALELLRRARLSLSALVESAGANIAGQTPREEVLRSLDSARRTLALQPMGEGASVAEREDHRESMKST